MLFILQHIEIDKKNLRKLKKKFKNIQIIQIFITIRINQNNY